MSDPNTRPTFKRLMATTGSGGSAGHRTKVSRHGARQTFRDSSPEARMCLGWQRLREQDAADSIRLANDPRVMLPGPDEDTTK